MSSRHSEGETNQEFVERCSALRAQGIDDVVLVTSGPWTDADLAVIGDAVGPAQDL